MDKQQLIRQNSLQASEISRLRLENRDLKNKSKHTVAWKNAAWDQVDSLKAKVRRLEEQLNMRKGFPLNKYVQENQQLKMELQIAKNTLNINRLRNPTLSEWLCRSIVRWINKRKK